MIKESFFVFTLKLYVLLRHGRTKNDFQGNETSFAFFETKQIEIFTLNIIKSHSEQERTHAHTYIVDVI